MKRRREPKPFFRTQTRSWYVQLEGRQINLGKDREVAFQKYHELMTRRRTVGEFNNVAKLLEQYWQWCQRNLAETTCDRRKLILRSFKQHSGRLKVGNIRAHHVQDWINEKYAGRSSTYHHNLITTVQGAFSWATKSGYIDRNPLAGMPKPRPRVRQEFIPADLWQKAIDAATDQPFEDFLVFMLTTGARPQEAMRIESRHFDAERQCITFPIEESKGRTRSRTIWLPDAAFQIIQRLSEATPEGRIFLNSRGRPWSRNAIRCRFRRLKVLLKCPKLCATTLRHSFAHYRLTKGQDTHTVSKLMGHVDGRMLETRYGHLDQNSDFMRQAADAVDAPINRQDSDNE